MVQSAFQERQLVVDIWNMFCTSKEWICKMQC